MLEGDEWKHVKEPERTYTRAEMQAKVDQDYIDGRIDQETWRLNTDYLSNPTETVGEA